MTRAEIVADTIKDYDLEIINTFLSTFGTPVSSRFKTNLRDYIISKLNIKCSYGFAEEALNLSSRVNSRRPIWRDNYFKIYISHLPSVFLHAVILREQLRDYGISLHLPRVNQISENKEKNIEALNTCDCLVAFLSKGFHNSYKTNQEIGFAIGKNIPLFSIERDDYTSLGLTNNSIKIKFNGIKNISEDIFKCILNQECIRDKLLNSLLLRFENSVSFQQVRDSFKAIKKNTYWNSKLLSRLDKSRENNAQISSCTINTSGELEGFIISQKMKLNN